MRHLGRLMATMACVAALILLAAPASADLKIHFIDAGQGDAILLEAPEGSVLIDAGNAGGSALSYLEQAGITHLDLAIATHAHADHIGGFSDILPAGTVSVGNVWYNGQTHPTRTFETFVDALAESGATYVEPIRGDVERFGALRLTVLHPETSAADFDGHLHDMNIVVRADYFNISVMLSGDAETSVEAALIEADLDLAADILKLGHHGSRTSTGADFLEAVSPTVAVYQAGTDNAFGHPHDEVILALDSAGVAVYGTDIQGTIIVRTNGESIDIDAEADGSVAARCIDINTASTGNLTRIIHVGAARALAIRDRRPWTALAELTSIPGLGPARVADIEAQGLACIG